MPKFSWKKKKAIAMYLNRRQWTRSSPLASGPYEIETEHLSGYYFITEGSSSSSPIYIITE